MNNSSNSYTFLESNEAVKQKKKAWMLTLSDLLSVLTGFFILLYALSKPSSTNFQTLVEHYKNSKELNSQMLDSKILSTNYLYQILKSKIEEAQAKDILINFDEDYLVISIPSKVLLEENEIVLSLKGKSIFYFLGGILSDIKNKIVINYIADTSTMPGINHSFFGLKSFDKALFFAKEMKDLTNLENLETFILDKGKNKLLIHNSKVDPNLYDERIDIIIYKSKND